MRITKLQQYVLFMQWSVMMGFDVSLSLSLSLSLPLSDFNNFSRNIPEEGYVGFIYRVACDSALLELSQVANLTQSFNNSFCH